MKVILASTSPRRQELLARIVDDFAVCPADIDESVQQDESAHNYVMRMATDKAQKIAQVSHITDGVVIGADTIGVFDDDILTKPTDKAHAFAMWDKLSHRTHHIWTAVCVVMVKDGKIHHQKTIKVSTDVTFIQLTDYQKQQYWQTGEPTDKAGAYAIQGGAMAWVRTINGSYTNVIGLPLAEMAELLDECLMLF